MTISVLSAAMFSLMTHVLPTASGKPVIGVPSPRQLGASGSTSSDSEAESSGDSSTPDLKPASKPKPVMRPSKKPGPGQVSLGSWEISTDPEDQDGFDSDAVTLVLGEHTQD